MEILILSVRFWQNFIKLAYLGVAIALSSTACVNAGTSNRLLVENDFSDNVNAAPTATPHNIDKKMDDRYGKFGRNLPAGLALPGTDVELRVLKDYGSIFVARGGGKPPNRIVFRDSVEVTQFQESVGSRTETIGGMPMKLQEPAMTALVSAIDQARESGLSISPRDTDSSSRSYDETVDLWKSRVDPALDHWVAQKKIAADDAERLRTLSPFDQVAEVLKLEKRGIYFAKDLSKSIMYSVAPPGTSQHLSMLAFDVSEYDDARVRDILAKHGWFQTVVSDMPHFTYLGVEESALKGLGLKKVKKGGQKFWIPDI